MRSCGEDVARRRIRALLLESDDLVRDAIQRALEARGVEVLLAAEGERGLAILLDELLDLDVLVTFLDLPGRDAWSLLHLVRRAGGERDLAIVVRTQDVVPAVTAQLTELGANAVVDGPVGPEALAEAALRAVEVSMRTSLADALEEPARARAATPSTSRALWPATLDRTRLAAA